eukprot:CAMPEP_0172546054 /NCGR_PEP_ID=MMETSP1067-20121228/15878_1 /TAXON_ID=265564 ORGANISM="Thalassiosira punctigera, Strain Tpunct2005C2" /NCGR_SAMPLE_ID=MMETSP1067 /ASSEMBLY_ACC=CAM_ASM_000444 /LENGTH=127 /DNA_ID=CAMNT_0013332919 /DNA_START=225 /DNA_END=610 /DNA_ORIENTATION=+
MKAADERLDSGDGQMRNTHDAQPGKKKQARLNPARRPRTAFGGSLNSSPFRNGLRADVVAMRYYPADLPSEDGVLMTPDIAIRIGMSQFWVLRPACPPAPPLGRRRRCDPSFDFPTAAIKEEEEAND